VYEPGGPTLGQQLWRFKTGDLVFSSPAISSGVVYFGSYDNYLYALDAGTGQEKWKFKTGDGVFSSPAISGGVVYFGSWDNYLYALDAGTGQEKWKFKAGDEVNSSPAISGGVVYFGSWDNYLYAFKDVTDTSVPSNETLVPPTDAPTSTATHTPTNTPTPTQTPTPAPAVICGTEVRGPFIALWLRYQTELGCPRSASPTTVRITKEQPFQGGHIFWQESRTQTYLVIFDGGGRTSGSWQDIYIGEVANALNSGVGKGCAGSAPAGYYPPAYQEAFGVVWCLLGNGGGLGWGLADVAAYADLVHLGEDGLIFRDSDGAVNRQAYILEFNGRFERIGY
jgi:hypothetical protein